MDQSPQYGVTLDEIMEFLQENMATKEDLKAFATKEDLKAFATKEDLKAFATKEDLTREIGKLRSDMIDYIAKQNLELKTDLVIIMRSEDRKLSALIELLAEKAVLSALEAKKLLAIQPFSQHI